MRSTVGIIRLRRDSEEQVGFMPLLGGVVLYLCAFLNDCGIVTQVLPSFLNRKSHFAPPSAKVIVRRNPHPINSLAILSMAQR